MFNLFKRLLSKSKKEGRERGKEEKEEIKVEHLKNWFKTKVDKIYSDAILKISDMRTGINNEVIKIKEDLALLGTARLHNPKISIKEKQFMEGNRKSYILAVNNLLREVYLDNYSNYSGIVEFCNNFNVKLEKFAKSTTRAYLILQEFFAHENRKISLDIRDLNNSVKGMDSIIKSINRDKIDKIQDKISDLDKLINQKTELENLLKAKDKNKEEITGNKEDIEKEIDKLIKTREYKQLNELKISKEIILTKIREADEKLIHVFSVIERPLKKLTRVVSEEHNLFVLESYIKNPINALMNDSDLKIINLLDELKNHLTTLTLELKDRKREKVLEIINGLTREFFTEFIKSHKELDKRLENLKKELDENELLSKENDFNSKIGLIKDNLKKIDDEINEYRERLEKINIQKMKDDLEREMDDLLNVEIDIKIY